MLSSKLSLYLGFCLHLIWGDASARAGVREGFVHSLFVYSLYMFFVPLRLSLFFTFALLGSTKIFSLHCTLSFTHPLSLLRYDSA